MWIRGSLERKSCSGRGILGERKQRSGQVFQRHGQKKYTWLLTQERAEFGYRLLIGGKKWKGNKPKNLLSCGPDQEKRWWFYYTQWMMSAWEALIIAFLKCDGANGFAAVWLREVGPFFYFSETRRTYLDDRNSYCPRCTILAPTEFFRNDSFRHSISVPWKKSLPFSKSL